MKKRKSVGYELPNREQLLKEIEEDRNKLVDIGKITKRQLELMVDAVHSAVGFYAKRYYDEGCDPDNTISWDNKIDLQNLETYLWEIISKERGWKKI